MGRALKKVGKLARRDMEVFFPGKIFLDLYVKVNKNWRDDDKQLKRFATITDRYGKYSSDSWAS